MEKKSIINTTVGRVLFNEYVPNSVDFVNELLTKKGIAWYYWKCIRKCGVTDTMHFLDAIKDIGFNMAFKGGLSFNLGDVIIPDQKDSLITDANSKVDEIRNNYSMGFITNNERYNQVIDVWTTTNARLTETRNENYSSDKAIVNSVYMMLEFRC